MENKKLKVGDVVFKPIYKNWLKTEFLKIEKCIITSVGKKYFYVDGNKTKPINVKTLQFEHKKYYTNSFYVYFSEQEIYDLIKCNELNKAIKLNVERRNFSLSECIEICKILNIKIDE